MRLIFIAVLLLAGCASQSQEQLLKQYFEDSARSQLSAALTSTARLAQAEALSLVSELGWSQSGIASYSNLRVIDSNSFEFCLDVSEIRFFEPSGETVQLHRSKTRMQMLASTTESSGVLKISNLQEVGEC